MNDVSCLDHLSVVQNVTNVPNVAPGLPAGARLHQFWEIWAALGVSPKVVTVLKKGYTLPFRFRLNPTRSPTIITCYINPQLHQLRNKNAVEPVASQTSVGFYNRLFLVPKPNKQGRPILDLSTLKQFLKSHSKLRQSETGTGVGHLHRCILPYTNSMSVQEVHAFTLSGSEPDPTKPVYSTHRP